MFFLESEDGDHIEEFGKYDCDSLWGWLVPDNLATEFSAIHSRTSGMTGIDEKWFVFWVFVDWEKVDGVPAVRFTNEYNWWENVEEKEMDHDEERIPEWIWCLVGNIKKARPYGEKHETRYGTKHFSSGTKVYCFPPQWDDGYENIVAIGKPRYKSHLMRMVIKMEESNRRAVDEAMLERNEEIVLNLLKENMPIDFIARTTKLSEDEIRLIQQKALVVA